MSRKLLFFFDGSSNATARPERSVPTNMYYLNQAFSNGQAGDQISFYFSGVGTRRDGISALTGAGLDEIVSDAYTNLASNYMPGDHLYFFGFSRGAVAARALSALVSYPGLLLDNALSQNFKDVWLAFLRKGSRSRERSRELLGERLMRNMVDPQPRIRFLGVFDTVPGHWFGSRVFSTMRHLDRGLESSVDIAVQILSIDDNRRKTFAPLVWSEEPGSGQQMEQVWMPGVHGDIGGHSNGVFLGNLSLLTMIERIKCHCPELEFDEGIVGRLVRDTFRRDRVVRVSSERSGLEHVILPRGTRKISGGPGQYFHYLVAGLLGKTIDIRGVKKAYHPKNVRLELAPYPTAYEAQIDEIVSRC